jgi:hypothetical protein
MEREFRLALLQPTETCKIKYLTCAGGKYDPTPSPQRAEPPPRYTATVLGFINRHDGPEDGTLTERCLTGGLPKFGSSYSNSFRRIVQTPGGISMFYDVGQGQGWQRNIVMDGRPHLPANIRQWYGDSRGHWEGNTRARSIPGPWKSETGVGARPAGNTSAPRLGRNRPFVLVAGGAIRLKCLARQLRLDGALSARRQFLDERG